MKAILTFDLEDPEDKMAMNRHMKSMDLALILFQLSQNHDDEKVREAVCKEMDVYGIDLDTMIN